MAALKAEFARELAQRMIEEITSQPQIVIVAVIGAGMKGTPGIAARVFNALGAAGHQRDCDCPGLERGQHQPRRPAGGRG